MIETTNVKETTIKTRRLSALLAAKVVAATAILTAGPAAAGSKWTSALDPGLTESESVSIQGVKNGYNGYGGEIAKTDGGNGSVGMQGVRNGYNGYGG